MRVQNGTRNKWSMAHALDGKYFALIRKDGNDNMVTKCQICSNHIRVSRNKTCNMFAHLRTQHQQQYDEFRMYISMTSVKYDGDAGDDGDDDDDIVTVCVSECIFILKIR